MGMVTYPPQPFPPSSGKTGDIATRVTTLENDVSTLQTGKASKTDIASVFSTETAYNVGDLVYYGGALYTCTTEHAAGAWNSEHFTATSIDAELGAINGNVASLGTDKADKANIAPVFSALANYSMGDLVYYDGALYECTTEHTASAWNSDHFTATAIDDQISAIYSNLTNLIGNNFKVIRVDGVSQQATVIPYPTGFNSGNTIPFALGVRNSATYNDVYWNVSHDSSNNERYIFTDNSGLHLVVDNAEEREKTFLIAIAKVAIPQPT